MTSLAEIADGPEAQTKSARIDLCMALSFANLAFYRVWQGGLSAENDYFGARVPRLLLGAVLVDVFILAFLGFGVLRFLRRIRGKAARACEWLLFVVVTLFGPQRLYLIHFFDGHVDRLGALSYSVLAACVAILFVFRPNTLRLVVRTTLLILSPFVLLTTSQAIWKIATPTPHAMRAKAPAPRFAENPKRRVVWIVFDEMDYTMAFEKRPSSLKLPEFDRLRSESWFATNVLPAADGTLISMPALVTGLPLLSTHPVSANDIELHVKDLRGSLRLGTQPTVFADARGRHLNSAVIGWYHHYCRVLGDQLANCVDDGERFDELGPCPECASTLVQAMGDGALRLLPYHNEEMVAYRDRWLQESGIRSFRRLREAAVSAVSDPNLGLILVHLPVPHYPFIYSRKTSGFIHQRGTYLDNLALADETLRDLRRAMEQSGTWDKTVTVITADHWWRYNLYAKGHQLNGDPVIYGFRVPLMVHLPGAKSETMFHPAINNRFLREGIIALLDHPEWTAGDFSDWVEGSRSRYPWDFVAHMDTEY